MFIRMIFLILVSSFFIACGPSSSISDEGAIFVNVGPEPQTIDPTLNSSIDGAIYINHVFEGLAARDTNNIVVPAVAESWDISDDYLTYTFYIKTNALWSDGKPVTANDFIYSWSRVVDPKTAANYSYQMEPLKNAKAITAGELPLSELGVVAIDDKTLEVTLEAPTPYFLELMAYAVYYPLRKDVVEANPDGWSLSPETYIGNGPYRLVERKIDDRLMVAKNENYWNADSIIAEKVVFILMDNQISSVAGIKDGSLHFANKFPYQDIPVLKEENILVIKPYLGVYYYNLNFTNETLKDPRVRRALSLAINREYIVENITKAGQVPAAGFIPPGVSDIKGDFRENGGDYFSLKPEDYEKNVAEARELLAQAGYPNGKGLPVIEFKTNPGEHIPLFEAVQQMWKEGLNIDSIISQEEWAVFQQTRSDGNFVVARNGWIGDYDDPMTFLGLYLARSSQNVSRYNSPEYDNTLMLAMSTGDQNIRMPLLHKAEKILMDDMALIPIYYYTLPLLVNPKLKGVQYDVLGKHKFFYAYLEE